MSVKEFLKKYGGVIFLVLCVIALIIIAVVAVVNALSESFGNTSGTTQDDILNWGTINSNNGYKIATRIPNIKRYSLTSVNTYELHDGLYQSLLLTKIENPHPTTSITYLVPMNVAGQDVASNQFITSDSLGRRETKYPSFNLSDNDVLFPAPDGKGKFSYFSVEDYRKKIEIVDIPLGHGGSPAKTYSPWFCDNPTNNLRYGSTDIPKGYTFAGLESKKASFIQSATPCGSDTYRPNFRRRAIYLKKNNSSSPEEINKNLLKEINKVITGWK